MTTILRPILFFFVLSFPSMLYATEAPWDHAMDAFTTDVSVPSKITVQTKVRDDSGELIESSLINSNLLRTVKGDILFVVTDGITNDKQIPEKEIKTMTETVEEKELQHTLLFLSALKSEYSWEETSLCQDIDNRRGCSYSFSGKIEDRRGTGIIWLDEQTRLPLMITWHITDVPFEEDDTLIHSLHQKDLYRINDKGQCYLHTSTTRIGAQYSLLFFKKDIEIETTQTFFAYKNRQMLPIVN